MTSFRQIDERSAEIWTIFKTGAKTGATAHLLQVPPPTSEFHTFRCVLVIIPSFVKIGPAVSEEFSGMLHGEEAEPAVVKRRWRHLLWGRKPPDVSRS